MTMARIVSVAVLCISLCSALAGQRTKEEEAVERRITDTLHQMYEAERRKDLKFVLSHLADDFAEVAGNGGVYHRADIEAEWSNVALHDYKLSDCAFKLMTRDSATSNPARSRFSPRELLITLIPPTRAWALRALFSMTTRPFS
jgi:hypothetical protein